jgi:hypothetical protein
MKKVPQKSPDLSNATKGVRSNRASKRSNIVDLKGRLKIPETKTYFYNEEMNAAKYIRRLC